MRASENKPAKAHDDDLLRKEDIPAFRAWLGTKGVVVRDPSPRDTKKGLLFVVESPAGRLHVREPREPDQKYARTDLGLGPSIAMFLKNPMVTAVGAAVRPPKPAAPVKSAVILPVGVKPVVPKGMAYISNDGEHVAADQAATTAFTAPLPEGSEVALRPLTEHEQDLRDDFAIHAPLHQGYNESLRDFAIRRWEYAKLMLELRPV